MGLDELRVKIDAADKRLLEVLLERFELVERVGRFKEENGLKVEDLGREAAVLRRIAEKVEAAGKDEYLQGVLRIYREIFVQSKGIQR